MTETVALIFISFAFGTGAGILAQALVNWVRMKGDKLALPPALRPNFKPDDAEVGLLSDEWRTTIQMQMKFNDLIIRFRAIVLSVFVISVGVLFYGHCMDEVSGTDLIVMLAMLLVFWIACLLLDFGYYHQLLLGAVRHAKKFDENKYFRDKGLFGLTERINMEIGLLRTKVIMWLFYLLPASIVFVLVLLKKTGVI
jgi:hypothetical protein